MRKKVIVLMISLMCIASLYGCKKDNTDEQGKEQGQQGSSYTHSDTFVPLEVESTEPSGAQGDEQGQQGAGQDKIEEEPRTDLDQYFDLVIEPEAPTVSWELPQEVSSETESTEQSIELVVDSINVNKAITHVKNSNGYTSIKVLEWFRDNAVDITTYQVLFDDKDLYCISEDDFGKVYVNEDNYEYYLMMSDDSYYEDGDYETTEAAEN